MPSMETSVAFSVRQVSCVDWPGWIVSGLAESDAVGCGGGGGGGGGGGVLFLAQPAIRKSAANTSNTMDCLVRFFTSCLQKNHKLQNPELPFVMQYMNVNFYFLLQFGWEFSPFVVSACCLVPSASMLQISDRPPCLDSYTMCRPSGDQEGKSLTPESCVSCTHCRVVTSIR